jgi:hypothetical protein
MAQSTAITSDSISMQMYVARVGWQIELLVEHPTQDLAVHHTA